MFDQATIAQIDGGAFRAPPARKPKSLFQFLTWRGGLRSHPDLKSILDGRCGWMVRKSGLSLDAAREACIEEGFLQDHESRDYEPTINDLLELIAAEAAGNKQYRIHEALDAMEYESARAAIGVAARTCHPVRSSASEGTRVQSGNRGKSSMDERDIAIAMAKEGVATLSEIAELAGVSRQLVRYWCMGAGVDIAKSRAAWLAKEWRRRIKIT